MSIIALSCGDTNGIGPEISIKLIQLKANKNNKFILSIPENIFENYINQIPNNIYYQIFNNNTIVKNYKANVIINLLPSVKFEPGIPTEDSGRASFESLLKSLDFVDKNIADGIVTAPISKYAIKKAGINFPGHTELIADRYGVKTPVMTFISPKFLVALVTIHEPIKNVSKLLNEDLLYNVIQTLKQSLKFDFGIESATIAVLGLNPHAGENGEIGDEEINVISKIIDNDNSLFGPFVPDAYFGDKKFKKFDLTLGMYHDQVLIPFKYIAFDKGVNYTAGLPIVRTSPDHGTAYDITGKMVANPKSILHAYNWAVKIINNRKKC